MRIPLVLLASSLVLAACNAGTDVQYLDFADPEAEDSKADDPIAPPLPTCTTELARAVLSSKDASGRSVLSTLRNGTLPAQYFATQRNLAAKDALLRGPEIFPSMAELIARAEYNVDFQTYVWENDTDPANSILDGLRRLGERIHRERPQGPAVRVRILIDVTGLGFASKLSTIPRTFAKLAALQLDPNAVEVQLGYYYHLAFGNLHVKTVVADGRAAIITGANPQAHHNYADPWNDAGFRVDGEIAIALTADFNDAWRRGHRWTCGAREDQELSQCSEKPTVESVAVVSMPELASACLPIFVVGRKASGNPLSNSVDNPQDQAFLGAFRSAQHTIRMLTPNLNDDAAKAGLVAAAVRGVRVEIVLSKEFNDGSENLPGQGGTNEKNAAALYEALAAQLPDPALRCARLEIRWYSLDGVTPIEGNGLYASHSKYLSIDSAAAIVGTANMDTQSWNNSREVNLLVDDEATTRSWDEQVFAPAWNGGVSTLAADCGR